MTTNTLVSLLLGFFLWDYGYPQELKDMPVFFRERKSEHCCRFLREYKKSNGEIAVRMIRLPRTGRSALPEGIFASDTRCLLTTDWNDWWLRFGRRMYEYERNSAPNPVAWAALAGHKDNLMPDHGVYVPPTWNTKVNLSAGDSYIPGAEFSMVDEELEIQVNEKNCRLLRSFRLGRDGAWNRQVWKGFTREDASLFFEALVYAIDNPWVFADDRMVPVNADTGKSRIAGRPTNWPTIYFSVSWDGVFDSDHHVLVNNDRYEWFDASGESHRLDCQGLAFRILRDMFPDNDCDPDNGKWEMLDVSN